MSGIVATGIILSGIFLYVLTLLLAIMIKHLLRDKKEERGE